MRLDISLLPAVLAVCRLDAGTDVPEWALAGSFRSVTVTAEETSIVCEEDRVPEVGFADGD